jgi:hypothetical protein
MVSPGAGKCAVLITISVLELPTTTMEGEAFVSGMPVGLKDENQIDGLN